MLSNAYRVKYPSHDDFIQLEHRYTRMYPIVAMRIQITSIINCILVNFSPYKPRLAGFKQRSNTGKSQKSVLSYSTYVHIYICQNWCVPFIDCILFMYVIFTLICCTILSYLIHRKINKYIKHKLTLLPINHHLNTYND